ncbi:hypothetical protein S245_053749 [Arachis hypogaea]
MRNFYIGPGPLSQAHCDATLPCGVHHHLLLLLRHSVTEYLISCSRRHHFSSRVKDI